MPYTRAPVHNAAEVKIDWTTLTPEADEAELPVSALYDGNDNGVAEVADKATEAPAVE